MNLQNICTLLPGQWNVNTSKNHKNKIVRNDGLTIYFCYGDVFPLYGLTGRIVIGFSRPHDAKGQYLTLWADKGTGTIPDPRITVVDTKTDEQIAKEIVRRLLPDAEKVFALATTAINSHNKFETDKVWAANKIAFHCGTEPERHYQTKILTGKVDPYKGAKLAAFQENGYGGFMISGKNSISLELNGMNIDLAVEIAEALRAILSRRASQ